MALLTIDHYADSLGFQTSCSVILPQRRFEDAPVGGRYPTLWLLHGSSDDHTSWLRFSAIERYVAELRWAVVMPAVHQSCYANMAAGGRYWDYISDELPAMLEEWLPVATEREQRYVAGISMGGFGAFKLALNRPERFAAAASLSGALFLYPHDMREQFSCPSRAEIWLSVYGSADAIERSEDDLLHQARRRHQAGAQMPRLFACCGRDDHLFDLNERSIASMRREGLAIEYETQAGGHDWTYWDGRIQDCLEWMA
ncbi:MAG: alpha/beta hydrolase-fold protein [Planctomycetota bacterium]|nr:alpha/beta hydrolase-fold protein [Planctomycetota bacterium]